MPNYASYLQAYYNVDSQRFCDANGSPLTIDQLPRVTLTQQLYLILILLRDNGQRFTYNDDDVLAWAADDDWDDNSDVLLRAENADINDPTEFAGAASMPGLGTVAIKIDADSANLQSALGTSEQIVIYGELRIFRPGATGPYFIGQMEMRARNLVDFAAVNPPAIPANYYTKAQVDALIAPTAPDTYTADETLAAVSGRRRIFGDTNTADVILTLHAAGDAPTTELAIAKYGSANSLRIRPAAGETINGSANDLVLTGHGEAVILWPITGEGWRLLNFTYYRS